MKQLRTVAFMACATAIVCALSASFASAETILPALWLVNGAEPAAADVSETTGEMLLEDEKAGSGFLCSYIWVGTLGPAGADEVKEVLNLKLEAISSTPLAGLALIGTGAGTDCVTAKGCAEGSASSPMEVWPENLPWKTELILMENGEFLDKILNMGYDMLCLILTINTSNLCEIAETTLPVSNDVETGDAEMPGGSQETPNMTCTVGGAGSGKNVTDGLSTITSPSGLVTVSSE